MATSGEFVKSQTLSGVSTAGPSRAQALLNVCCALPLWYQKPTINKFILYNKIRGRHLRCTAAWPCQLLAALRLPIGPATVVLKTHNQ